METIQKEFLLKEYDKLNNEVSKLMEETRTREKYSLTIIALIAAWIYTEILKQQDIKITRKELTSIVHLLSWIPLAVTLLYGMSVFFIYKNIIWIGNYLSIIERHCLNGLKSHEGEVFGWERYFSIQNKRSHFVLCTWIFWIGQIVIAFIIIYKSYSLTSGTQTHCCH